MSSQDNKLWAELCKELSYSPAYAISYLIDPSIFYFLNNKTISNDKKLNIYIIYDSTLNNEKLLIFDDGVGFTKLDLESLKNYELLSIKGWKQWIRALQWIGNGAKIYSKHIDENYCNYLVYKYENNQLKVSKFSTYDSNEFVSRTKFNNGVLFQIQIDYKWSINEYCIIVEQLNKIFQKYVNTNKISFKAVYRGNNEFFDCSDKNNLISISSYRKALPLKKINKPNLISINENSKILINEKIELNKTTITINGYAGILEKPNNKDSGIYCFSGNKLILGVLPYSALKPEEIFGTYNNNEYNSIYCELEITNLPLKITGDGFLLSHEDRQKIIDTLSSIIGKQGETQNFNKITTLINTKYKNKTEIVTLETIKEYGTLGDDILNSMKITKAIIDVKVETIKNNNRESNLYSIKDEYGKEFKIELIRATNKETSGYWIKKKYSDTGIIYIYFNYEHPFLRPIISSKRSYNTFCEFIIYYIMAEEKAINEGASVEELKILINNYLRKDN